MIELIQIPWSPFCIVQRRILEAGGVQFKISNTSYADRSLIWRLTRERYYAVPVLRDGKVVIFETDDDSQVIAKYINHKFEFDLFPDRWRGIQSIVWRNIENEVEAIGFKLNDIHYREVVSKKDLAGFVRHKERKFGRGCLEAWAEQQPRLLESLANKLIAFEQMLASHPFLLDETPRFVDFDLYGILGNFLYSGHYELPQAHTRLSQWYDRMTKVKIAPSEKLRT